MMAKRRYQVPVQIVMTLFLLLQLAACGGGGGGGGNATSGTAGQTIGGSVGDGPVIDAILNIYASDGILVHTTTSDSRARYTASFQVNDNQYPLTIEVKGGIDLVTRRAPDFSLWSVVTGPPQNGIININPFTTVVVEMARRMPGGLIRANVETATRIVQEQLNFGLDVELVPDSLHTDVNENNVAVIIKSSEVLGEMIRRAHNSLNEIGLSADMDDTVSLLAQDLVDGVLDGSGSNDVRVVDIFTLMSVQVLTEAMRNELRVDGVNATSALDDAILQTQPSTSFSKLSDSVRVNRAMLLQAQSAVLVAAASTASNDLERLSSSLQTVEIGSYPANIDPAIADSTSNGVDGAMADLLSQASSETVPAPSEPVPAPSEPGPVETTGNPSNSAPQLSGSPATSVNVDDVYSFQPSAFDSDGGELTFSIQNRPVWCGFNENTGRLSGTPNPGDVGVNGNIIITVSDGLSTDVIGPFSIRVNEVTVEPPPESVAERKYNPGHYISMNKFEKQSALIDAIKPGVVGMQRRYMWRTLEPSFGKYDFSSIQSDLDLLAGQGMRLVIFIEDKTFNGEIPTPSYLQADYTLVNRNRGYTAKRWVPYVADRFKLLIEELGRQLDDHPALEGIAIQETALSLDGAVLTDNGYTAEKYRDTLIDTLLTAASSFPKSQVFWYMNFLPMHQSYIAQVANAVAPAGVTMGGPDVLPDQSTLKKLTYPFFDDFKGKMTLFNSMQNDSYSHLHEDTSFPTRYWTMEELFRFARDQLNVSYIFWNHKTWAGPDDAYTWINALPVIGANPVFDQ